MVFLTNKLDILKKIHPILLRASMLTVLLWANKCKGMIFCRVRMTVIASQLIPAIREIAHWWNGNPPILNISRPIINSWVSPLSTHLACLKLINNKSPPRLWTKNNFNPLGPRKTPEVNTKLGNSSNKLSSIITQLIITLLLPMAKSENKQIKEKALARIRIGIYYCIVLGSIVKYFILQI